MQEIKNLKPKKQVVWLRIVRFIQGFLFIGLEKYFSRKVEKYLGLKCENI